MVMGIKNTVFSAYIAEVYQNFGWSCYLHYRGYSQRL